MGPSIRSAAVSLAWGAGVVHAAINIDGTQAVAPVTKDDPSPIGDPSTYYPSVHDCPLPCVDFANPYSWIPYLSVDRLRRCKEPMLLDFSARQLLDDPSSNILIRSCTLGGSRPVTVSTTAAWVENPKKASTLFRPSLDNAPACVDPGTQVQDQLELATTNGGKGDAAEVASLLEGMEKYFGARDNCDENFLFAYHKQTVASVYIGAGLGKSTAQSTLEALAAHLRTSSPVSNRTVAQLCGNGRQPERIVGVSIDTTGNLAAVQKTALQWSKGTCAVDGHLQSAGQLPGAKVFDIAGSNMTLSGNSTSFASQFRTRASNLWNSLDKRATCSYIRVDDGDGCDSLVSRCSISVSDFNKYNPKSDLCSTLHPGDYVCCSSGDPYTEPKPDPPKKNSDGTCATHLIEDGDSCDTLSKKFGVSVSDIEKWNEKTWAWTECEGMLKRYNMCLSEGSPPMPPPQEGTECGPLVPGTARPKDESTSLADLNPCPLKACCSNWGFCGVFPAHCEVHAPEVGGPGTKEPGYESTCISNCEMEIQQNSGPPGTFERIGYYEAFGLDRECLWLRAKHANTDGSYTKIHWGFADIDPNTWKPVINEGSKEWADFKALSNVKRIISLGGWAYSTEAATYDILRSAIITNRDTFARNLAQFVEDEGIDGVDIDWEYPGAPDIEVNGQVIGKKSDGLDYLKFLSLLKNYVGDDKSVSIAAPASFWYLKAFPIDRIAAVIDYIVFMTYDLHGQWDYGKPNSFDSCPSGTCIRSHINLTETINSLAIITKAGVPNNKIFVGEASYGRSFHMAQDGCWEPMCDFTGSMTQSDAAPGRCTKTGGYLAHAEINEIIKVGSGVRMFHDGASNSDIMLYNGDYVSYMTHTTKDTRRADWKNLNFAGTIDWAVDLQAFTEEDMNAPPDRPESGTGCIQGDDDTLNSADLCEFSCAYGFCPESLCTCTHTGTLKDLPSETSRGPVKAMDELDVDMNRLCKFACKYDYCPGDVCTADEPDDDNDDEDGGKVDGAFDYAGAREENQWKCQIFKDPDYMDSSAVQCKPVCQPELDEFEEEGWTRSYGCIGLFPLDKEIPWETYSGVVSAPGMCHCNNWLVNYFADLVIEALPIIAQIGCYILMSSLKWVLDVGLSAVTGGTGRALSAGVDMATTAAETISYIYPDDEDPAGAFEWWLSPCGGSDLVPDDVRRIFDILNATPSGRSSYKPPKKIPKGSGKKGDDGNPIDRSKPRSPGKGSGSGNKPCKIPKALQAERKGAAKNTLRKQECVKDKTKITELIITSISYEPNAKATPVIKHCDKAWSQACFHYSSAVRVNPHWETITCHPEAATTKHRLEGSATSKWKAQHTGAHWRDPANRPRKGQCDMDEYPPAHLLGEDTEAYIQGGISSKGQLVRYLPSNENQGAGKLWKGACFNGPVQSLSDKALQDKVANAPAAEKKVAKAVVNGKDWEQTFARVSVDTHPEFSMTWGQSGNPPVEDGLRDNTCWPSGLAPKDPGFALLTFDPYYGGKSPPYDYTKDYSLPQNGGP